MDPVSKIGHHYRNRYSATDKEGLHTFLDKALRLGLLVPNPEAKWSSPAMVLKKKDGTIRVVVDLRLVNSITMPKSESHLDVMSFLNSLGKHKFFAVFDIVNAIGASS